jgi:5-(carboxyamino)imidazole ribonucleotide synthase
MVNILGEDLAPVLKELPKFDENVKLHLYGKRGSPEPKRKMGHLTVRTRQPEEVAAWVRTFYPK